MRRGTRWWWCLVLIALKNTARAGKSVHVAVNTFGGIPYVRSYRVYCRIYSYPPSESPYVPDETDLMACSDNYVFTDEDPEDGTQNRQCLACEEGKYQEQAYCSESYRTPMIPDASFDWNDDDDTITGAHCCRKETDGQNCRPCLYDHGYVANTGAGTGCKLC